MEKSFEHKEDKITVKDILITLLISISISFILLSFIRITVVNGHSMDTTLYDRQRLMLNTKAYSHKDPEYKDIIVIEREDLNVKHLIKRVIGTPGDKISIKNNKLYINDNLIKENYIKEEMNTQDLEIVIPEGKVFVMGDNRNESVDSRNPIIGLINQEDIVGKVVFNISGFKFIK